MEPPLHKGKHYVLALGIALSAILIVLFARDFAQTPSFEKFSLIGSDDPYTQTICSSMPKYHLKADRHLASSLETAENHFAFLDDGAVIECLDAQAIPAIQKGIGKHFLPHCQASIVIAVDRSQTDWVPTTWKDLLTCPVDIGFPRPTIEARAALAAIAFGLEGENYTKTSALKLLEQINSAGHFKLGASDCPLTICFDYQAAQRIRNGQDIEIVVPKDGTFSFKLGLLSNRPLIAVLHEKDLRDAGLRLLDGTCNTSFYPSGSNWESAVALTGIERFNAETKDITEDIRRSVQHTRRFSPANNAENTCFSVIVLIAILFWTASVLHRSPQKVVHRWIYMLSGLCIGWIVLMLLKRQLPLCFLSRMCWYAYYVFLLGMPLAMLYIAAMIDRPYANAKLPKWFIPFLILYPALLLLVFTNDFHRLVFQFDLHGNWDSEYHYQIGYYIVFGYCVLTFLLSLVLLIIKNIKGPKKYTLINPCIIAALLIGYNIGYAFGISFIRNSNLVLVFCTLAMLFLESVLYSGLIPTNTHYKDLFSSSPLNMQLLDERGTPVLASAYAEELEPDHRTAIIFAPGVCLNKDDDTLLHSQPIRGGLVVWQEDISLLNKLHRKVKTSVKAIQTANTLLQRSNEARKQEIALRTKVQLFSLLEKDIEDRANELALAVRNLSEDKNSEEQLPCIILLLCYIKRRCNLVFIAQEDPQMLGVDLAVYLDELSEFAAYADIHALVRCKIPDAIEINFAVACYDFYFSLLSWALNDNRATLIGQLEKTDGKLGFEILSSKSAETFTFPDSFRNSIQTANAKITHRTLDDMESIVLTFPKEKGNG